MTVRDYFRRRRLHFMVALLGVSALAVVVLWLTIDLLRPMPPRTVTMVTGPEGGAFHELGRRYRDFLARTGIELRLLPTAGAIENLHLLNDPRSGASVGFLQSGTTDRKASADLVSLGTMFYEPLWFFYRGVYPGQRLEELRGRRISIGRDGSGSRFLSLELLARNGISEQFAELLPLTPGETARKLLSGEIDAGLMVASWDSPAVRQLLAARNIELASFPRADAYVALYPFLSKLVVPAGVGDMATNRPPVDKVLLASKASLVVRAGLHPAIQYLLLDAAEHIHSGPGIFNRAGQFPAGESIDLPLSDEARRFYRTGSPFLQRYLPFWLAVWIGRLLVLLIPVIGILYPLARLLPAFLGWTMRHRVHKLYEELRSIEREWEARGTDARADDLIALLKKLEGRADHIWLPISSIGNLYLFKQHLLLVRERLEGRPG